ncbi:dynamin family protein [Halocynthiibacter namhaensis]|uniref:dynamin family protein n=1 Tax=Halocynthiibacter namhaensis TaxID=1290553 RepID=UPI0005797060|nr:dynamin family protein [Halocynthiibacter namhaensis]
MIEFPGVEAELHDLNRFLSFVAEQAATPELDVLRADAEQHVHRLSSAVGIAFAGEFSAGKSSLANMLAGADILPTGIRHLPLPLVILNYSEKPRTVAGWWGKEHKAFDGVALEAAAETAPDFISVGMNTTALQQVSLFDLPGAGASGVTYDDTNTLDLLKFVDCAIWCTNGTSAWRESERALWSQVPGDLMKNSLLAVTHADLPSVIDDMPQLMQRLSAEKGTMFRDVVPIATPEAVHALADGPEPDFDRWDASGGQLLAEKILEVASSRREFDIENARNDIATRFLPLMSAGVEAPAVVARAPSNALLDDWQLRLTQICEDTREADDWDSTAFLQSCQEVIEDFSDRLISEILPGQQSEWVVEEFEKATDILLLLQFETGEYPLQDAVDILAQLGDTLAWSGSHVAA